MTCTHHWTVTSECPRCLRAELDTERARAERLEKEVAEWKSAFHRRGAALARPCISCGYQPKTVSALAAELEAKS